MSIPYSRFQCAIVDKKTSYSSFDNAIVDLLALLSILSRYGRFFNARVAFLRYSRFVCAIVDFR